MKNILSHTKTAIILLIVTLLFLGLCAYMLVRPIAYGMSYNNRTVYEDTTFEGSMTLYPGGKIVNKNTNFNVELEYYYYYKNGYVFSLRAENDAEYKTETAYIDENFDESVNAPFYAAKANAFALTFEGPDDFSTTYTCMGTIIFAIAGGVVALALIALTVSSFVLSKKAKSKE